MRTCDAAVLVLRETNNPAVMWGDERLCHLIANRAGMRAVGRAWKTSARVLANLARCPGDLVPGFTTCGPRRRPVRIFWLGEHAPARALEAMRKRAAAGSGREASADMVGPAGRPDYAEHTAYQTEEADPDPAGQVADDPFDAAAASRRATAAMRERMDLLAGGRPRWHRPSPRRPVP